MADTVEIKISANSEQAVKALAQVEDSLEKVGDASRETGNKSNDLTDSLGDQLLTWGSIAGAVWVSVSALQECLKEFIEDEEAVSKLNSALRVNGQFTEENSQALQDYAKALSDLTVYAVSDIENIMALGLNMGITADKIEDASKSALGLSSTLGIDLDSAMRMVAQAGEGNYQMLSRYVPELKGATDATEKARIAQEFFAKAFMNSEAETQTFGGSIKQLTNLVNEIKSTFGEIFAHAFRPAIKALKDLIETGQGMEGLRNVAKVVSSGLMILASTIVTIAEWATSQFDAMFGKSQRNAEIDKAFQEKRFDDWRRLLGEAYNEDTAWADRSKNLWKDTAEELKKLWSENDTQIKDAKLVVNKEIINSEEELKNTSLQIAENYYTALQDFEIQYKQNKEELALQEVIDNEMREQQKYEQAKATLDAMYLEERNNADRKKAITAELEALDKAHLKNVQKLESDEAKARAEINKQAFETKKYFAEAGVRAVVDSASEEKATVGSVLASLIRAEANALAEKATMRAILEFASGNFIGAGALTASAVAIRVGGEAVASSVEGNTKKMAEGGIIDEPVVGYGASGRRYMFGEAGAEAVVPLNGSSGAGAGAGTSIYIQSLNIQAQNVDDIVEQLQNYNNRTGVRRTK